MNNYNISVNSCYSLCVTDALTWTSEAGAQLCQFNRKRQELSMQDQEILIIRAGRVGMEGVVG